MGKVSVTSKDVIVVMRHDPNSSDIVDIAIVWDRALFDDDDQEALHEAEMQATDREIAFIVADAETENFDQAKRRWANSLTRDNFIKQTDLWFESVIMPVIEEVL